MGRGFDGKKEAVCQIPSLLLHLWRALPIPSSALFRMEQQWDTGREKEGWEGGGEHLWRRGGVHGRRRRRRRRARLSRSPRRQRNKTNASGGAASLVAGCCPKGRRGRRRRRRRKAISSSSFLEAFALVLVLLLLLLLPLSHTQHMFFVCLLLLLSSVVLCPPPPPPPPATPCTKRGGRRASRMEGAAVPIWRASPPVAIPSLYVVIVGSFVVLECCLCCLHEPQGPSTLRSTYRPDGGRDTKL